MKVEKIDIKKEVLDIPRGKEYMDFIERREMSSLMCKDGEIPPYIEMTANKVRYLVQKVFQPRPRRENGVKPFAEDKYYLVKIDDRDLFNELLEIRDSLLNELVDKKTNYYRELIVEELDYQKGRIKRLPWYKRLFNMF
jgi:hypothetical protein